MSHLLSGLDQNQVYSIKIEARSGEEVAVSETLTTTTLSTVLRDVWFNTSNNRIYWLEAGNADKYRVVYSTNQDLTGATTSETPDGSQNYIAIASPIPNTKYYFKVTGMNSDGEENFLKDNSANDIVYSSTTLSPVATGLTYSNVYTSSATFTWDKVTSAQASGYRLEASKSAGFEVYVSSETRDINKNSLLLQLDPNTEYYYRLGTINSENELNYTTVSPTLKVDTLSNPLQNTESVLQKTATWGDITVTFVSLPTSPQSVSCDGYQLDVSKSEDFTSVLSSATTFNTETSLTVSDLNFTTVYYARIATINVTGKKNYTYLGPITTESAGAPTNIEISNIYQSSATIKFTPKDPIPSKYVITIYNDEAYTSIKWNKEFDPGELPVVEGKLQINTNDYSVSLDMNKRYWFLVGAKYGTSAEAVTDTAPAFNSPKYTLPSNASNVNVSNATADTITASYDTINSVDAYAFKLDLSANINFETLISKISEAETSATTIDDLLPNTTYYLRGAAINSDGEGLYKNLGSTVTMTNEAVYQQIFPESQKISVLFLTNYNPIGTKFILQCSNDNFNSNIINAVANSTDTQRITISCDGLTANTQYGLRVMSENWIGKRTPAVEFASQRTLTPFPDVDANANFYSSTFNYILVSWPGTYDNDSNAKFAVGTKYPLKTFDYSDPENPVIISSGSHTSSAEGRQNFESTNLNSNTDYGFQIAVLNADNEESQYNDMPRFYTKPNVPLIGPSTFTAIGLDNFTLNWQHNRNWAGTSYDVEISSFSDFSEIIISTTVSGTSFSPADLEHDAEYYARVRANAEVGGRNNGYSSWKAVGPVRTYAQATNTAYNSNNNTITLETSYGNISLYSPNGSFSVNQEIMLMPLFSSTFTTGNYSTTQSAASLRLLPAKLGLLVKPALARYTLLSPVTITLHFKKTDLAPSVQDKDFSKIVLAVYDDNLGLYKPLETTYTEVPATPNLSGSRQYAQSTHFMSSAGTVQHMVTARAWQLGVFQLMFTEQNTATSQIKVYPNPYRPNSKHGDVHITNLPDLGKGSTIKIYNFLGELINEMQATGTHKTWDGTNKAGNDVASGVYLIFVRSNDDKSLKAVHKLAIER